MTQKVTLSEAIDVSESDYIRTCNKILAIKQRRDEGERIDFKTAAWFYERLRDCEKDLRHLEDERRRLEAQHAELEQQHGAIPTPEVSTAVRGLLGEAIELLFARRERAPRNRRKEAML